MYEIIKDDKFIKIAKKFFNNNPKLQDKFKIVIYQLVINPYEPSLRTHSLKGKLKGLSSCSLNYEYRIILNIKIVEDKIYLIDIGTHKKVYK